jgi:DNA-binding response OmpR family regulator
MRIYKHILKVRGEPEKGWKFSPVTDLQQPPKLLLVDDEKSILDYVGLGLKYEGFPFVTAASCAEARKRMAEEDIGLAVLDRMLPDGDGLTLCKWIKDHKDVPVLILSALGEVEDRVEGLNVGADDYLAKPFQFVELVARIRALLRRPKVAAQAEGTDDIVSGDLRISRSRRRVFLRSQEVELTPKEFELLEFLASRTGRVFSKDELVDHLWGTDFDGFTNTVEVHVSALRQKLGDHSRKMIRTVRGVGYAWEG